MSHYRDIHHNHREHHGNYYRSDFNHRIISYFFEKLKHNKKLILLLIIAIVIIIAIGLFLLISLLPVIYKGIEYININGIKGAVDLINQFVDKLWSGKGQLI